MTRAAVPADSIATVRGLGRSKQPILALLLVFAFWGACVAEVALSPLVVGLVPQAYGGLAMGLTATAVFLLLTVTFARSSLPQLRTMGIVPDQGSPKRLAGGVLFGLLLVGIYFVITGRIADIAWTRNAEVGVAATSLAVVGTLAGAAAEELAFRGYPLRRLMATYGLWPAQIIVAAAFILYHNLIAGWPVLPAIVGTGLGSILFGMAAVASRGLAVPIGLHAAWNFGMWAGGTRELPAPWHIERIDLANGELANWTAYPIAAIAGIAFFLMLYHRQTRRQTAQP